MSEGNIWHLIAGLGATLLALMVTIFGAMLRSKANEIISILRELRATIVKTGERVAHLEGRMKVK